MSCAWPAVVVCPTLELSDMRQHGTAARERAGNRGGPTMETEREQRQRVPRHDGGDERTAPPRQERMPRRGMLRAALGVAAATVGAGVLLETQPGTALETQPGTAEASAGSFDAS